MFYDASLSTINTEGETTTTYRRSHRTQSSHSASFGNYVSIGLRRVIHSHIYIYMYDRGVRAGRRASCYGMLLGRHAAAVSSVD